MSVHDRRSRGIFVTGTDTGAGKTRIACALLRGFAERRERVVGMKPVAAGATHGARGLSNEDVERLSEASNVAAPAEWVNPYCFEPAIAPHIAAQEAGVRIDERRIVDAYRALTHLADRVIVEGAGGFAVPLGPRLDMAGLARALGLPVVLVVGLRLGCLNHAILTAQAVQRAGLVLVGWVGNCIDRKMSHVDANLDALRERLPGAFLGVVPFRTDWQREVSAELDLERLAELTHAGS